MPAKGDMDNSQGAEVGLQREHGQRGSPQLTAALLPAPLGPSKSPELMTPARSATTEQGPVEFQTRVCGSEQDAWKFVYGSMSLNIR